MFGYVLAQRVALILWHRTEVRICIARKSWQGLASHALAQRAALILWHRTEVRKSIARKSRQGLASHALTQRGNLDPVAQD
jgi:hypothetical protein